MAITNKGQQAQIDEAMAKAKSLGVDEATAKQTILNRLNEQGFKMQEGTLVRGETQNNAPNSSVVPTPATTTPQTTETPQETNLNSGTVAPTETVTTETPKPVETPKEITYPTQKPVSITPTENVAPSTGAKTEQITNIEDRNNQILSNLREGSKNAPQLFKDEATFRAAYGYNSADSDKKALMDAFFQSTQLKDEGGIYNALRTGNTNFSPEIMNTPEYKEAKMRNEAFARYSKYSTNELVSAIKSGDLIPGTKVYNDLYADPIMKQKLDEAKVFTSGNVVNTGTTGVKKTEDIINNNPNTKSALDDGRLSSEEWASMLETPEITSKRKDIEGKKNEYDTMKATYDNIETEVENEYKGTKATNSQLAKIIADRRKGMYRDLQVASDVYNNAVGTLNDMLTTQSKIAEVNIGMMQEERSNDRAIKMFELQQAYNNPDINSTNPQIARIAAQKLIDAENKFAIENGIPVSGRDYLGDAEKYAAANNVSLATAIQKTFTEPRKNSSEYKNAIAQQQRMVNGQMTEEEKVNAQQAFQLRQLAINNKFDLEKLAFQYDLSSKQKVGDAYFDMVSKGIDPATADAAVRQATGNWSGASGTTLLAAPENTIIPSRLKETTNPNGGKECGEYVNDITGVGVGSSWFSKYSKADTNNPNSAGVGNVIMWQPNPDDPKWNKYGHAGIIVGDNGDSWEVKSSNIRGDGAITIDRVPKTTPAYYNTEVSVKQKGQEGIRLSPEQQRITANQEKSAFRSNPEVKAFENSLNQNRSLIASLQRGTAPSDVAAVYQFMKSLDPNSVVRESEFAIAASASGLGDRAMNLYDKVVKGEKLTDEQRKEFGILAKEYVKSMGVTYDRLYDDMSRSFQYFGLPNEILPTRATTTLGSLSGSQTNTENTGVKLSSGRTLKLNPKP